MKKLYDNVNHVVWKDVVLEEQRQIENILAWSICMKTFLSNFFWNLSWRSWSRKQFEDDGTDWVNVTHCVDLVLLLPKVRIKEVLDLMLTFIYFSILLVNNISQLFSNLCLLWRNILSISCSGVEKTDVILKFLITNIDSWKCFTGLPWAMIEVCETHLRYLFVHQQNILWA